MNFIDKLIFWIDYRGDSCRRGISSGLSKLYGSHCRRTADRLSVNYYGKPTC